MKCVLMILTLVMLVALPLQADFLDDFETGYTLGENIAPLATTMGAVGGKYDIGQDGTVLGFIVDVDPTDASNQVLMSISAAGNSENFGLCLARNGGTTNQYVDYELSYRMYTSIPGGYDLSSLHRQGVGGVAAGADMWQINSVHGGNVVQMRGHTTSPWVYGVWSPLGTQDMARNKWHYFKEVVVDGVVSEYYSGDGVTYNLLGSIDTKTDENFEFMQFAAGSVGLFGWHDSSGGSVMWDDLKVTVIPDPATMILLLGGLLPVLRRKRHA